jgi:hypothetical protein
MYERWEQLQGINSIPGRPVQQSQVGISGREQQIQLDRSHWQMFVVNDASEQKANANAGSDETEISSILFMLH